uniref:SLAM family member 5-like n=1 Tax=Gopherus evgoodei TaxID=1825980 RepID=A0A8C4VWR9_9SAUR
MDLNPLRSDLQPGHGVRILGDSVTFLLEIPAEQVRTVAWTVNATRSIVTVTAGTPPNVIVLDSSYEGRLRVPENNSLQITSLRMKDTGTYGAQITTASGISNRHFLLFLQHIRQVPEPTIVCDSVTCVKETCNYNLHCTVRDGGDNVTYSWTHTAGGAVVPNGSILHISLSPRDAHLNATCTAQNPVSNSSTTASAKGLCAGNSLCRTDSCLKQKQTCTFIALPVLRESKENISLRTKFYPTRHNSLCRVTLPSAHTGGAGIRSLPLHQSQVFDPKWNLAPEATSLQILACKPARPGVVCCGFVCVTKAAL